MEKAFLFGLAMGMLGGAVLVANSCKARKMVINGQEDILNKIDELSADRQKSKKKEG